MLAACFGDDNASYNGAMRAEKSSVSDLLVLQRPGTYILLLCLSLRQFIEVGKLGEFEFPAGYYLYVGSALGPGGLAARLRRHKKLANDSEKRLHWHIDFLREQAQLLEIWCTPQPQRLEHEWAGVIGHSPETNALVPGFGSSDCSCESHLYQFALMPDNLAIAEHSSPVLKHLREAIRLLKPETDLIVIKNDDSSQRKA